MNDESSRRQIILVFQGGGALGSYQAGVYEALHEAGIEPDWVIGTSIGAINSALICGNTRDNRLPALRAFWERVTKKTGFFEGFGDFNTVSSAWSVAATGIPAFFTPTPWAVFGGFGAATNPAVGLYSTEPLKRTLLDLVDFDRVNASPPRLTVGAANVRTSEMKYFDSRADKLDVRHVLASGALPPAFPAVRIDNELFWDGGILSNSPTEIVFEDNPRRDALIFAVNVWNPDGDEPRNIWDVLHRQKDIQYSSRVTGHIAQHKKTHRLRRIISMLAEALPQEARDDPHLKELVSYGCVTRMHVAQLLAPRHESEGHAKDVDFTASGIRRRWDAGYTHTREMLAEKPWDRHADNMEGVILHERTMT